MDISDIRRRLLKDPIFRSLITSTLGLGWNLFYALFNVILGIHFRSYWFLSLFAYYLLLGIMRGYVVLWRHRSRDLAGPMFRNGGIGLIILSVFLSFVICMGIAEKHNPWYPKTVIYAIAALTFYMTVMAIISAVKAHGRDNATYILLRDIALVSVIGSVLSLERSMLGMFGVPEDSFTDMMEEVTGAVGVALILMIAVLLLRRSKRAGKSV